MPPKQKEYTAQPVDPRLLDLYTDYLISSFQSVTATGFSAMTDHAISHDAVTRFLGERPYTSKDLWRLVKPRVRQVETEDGAISFDDTIVEKAYTDENEIVAWHFDHSKGRNMKGMNLLNATYHNAAGTIPLAFEIVRKDTPYVDEETGKTKRRASVNKNQMMRDMFDQIIKNQVKFRYVLADIWFSSKENMQVVVDRRKHFIFALKANRLVALSLTDKRKGAFRSIESLNLEQDTAITCYLKGLAFPVKLMRKVFTNKDGSTGILYLATSDIDLDAPAIPAIYQTRWNVEEYHKSIKSNLGIAKSPTRTAVTQNNHFFASIYAYFKLELMSTKVSTNHFALKSKLYVRALMASFKELQSLKSQFALVSPA
ncbi:MAG: transposase [Candidatus Diapherotrites archaeon]